MNPFNQNDTFKNPHQRIRRRALPWIAILMRRVILKLVILLLVVPAWLYAAQTSGLDPEKVLTQFPELPWELKADEITYDQKANVYIARGNVEISKADKQLTADYIRFDHMSERAYAVGNVVFISGQDVLKGSSINIDMQRQVGTIHDGSVFLKENNFHITADKIEKTGEKTYEMEKATITTCDGDKPAWKISGKKVKVLLQGYGTVKHAKFYTRGVPVMYTPYFYYPANSKRQSGLLMPEFGNSNRKGYNYRQPYFWAISDSQDATFYVDYMTARGLKPGGEYRYFLSKTTKGAIMLDGMHDEKTDETGAPDAEYGFEDPDVQLPRTNQDRWWFRMSHYQLVPWNFATKLDLDAVSDQDYLREFESGYMGFDDTRKYFDRNFGRLLDDYNDPVRTNRLNFNRIWPTWNLNAEFRYFWDSTQENSDLPDITISRLPVVDLQGSKQRLFNSPFFYDFNTSYNYFYSHSGPRGHRGDIRPRIYYPWRFKKYFTFEPSAGLRETLYYLDDNQHNNDAGYDRWSSRELFDIRLDFFSEVYRVFDLNKMNIQKIKHSIRPQIVWDYIPEVSQSDVPEFDFIDRIEKQNLLSYSITNILTSKLLKGVVEKQAVGDDVSRGEVTPSADQFSYKDFLRLEIAQAYDFENSKRNFSPIFARLDFFPGQYVSIDADSGWSVYDNEFVSHNLAAAIWDKRGDKLFVQYRYDRRIQEDLVVDDQNVESILVSANAKVSNKFWVFGAYERNIEDNQHIRTELGFNYISQCWGFNFKYTERPAEEKFEFRIILNGLGGIGF